MSWLVVLADTMADPTPLLEFLFGWVPVLLDWLCHKGG